MCVGILQRMRVQFSFEPDAEHRAYLATRLPDLELRFGAPAPADVLVAGRPSVELLTTVAPNHLVFPFAGIPWATQELLRSGFSDLAVHNLHHNASATAEAAVALLLAAAKCVVPMHRSLEAGDWRPRYAPDPGVQLAGSTALVLGYGAIGKRVARALVGLDMRVLATRLSIVDMEHDGPVEVHPATSLTELLPRARVLVLALPETPTTRGLLGADELDALPEGAVLVNVARASIVDESALFDALRTRLHSAALDVHYVYPKDEAARAATAPATAPLHTLANVVLSPHRAGHGARVEIARYRELALRLEAIRDGTARPLALEDGY